LGDVVAVASFQTSLFEEACHVANIALQEFIRAEQRGSCKIAVPQVRVSRDISAIGDDHGQGGFWGRIEVVSRGGFVRRILMGARGICEGGMAKSYFWGPAGGGALSVSMSMLFCAATRSA